MTADGVPKRCTTAPIGAPMVIPARLFPATIVRGPGMDGGTCCAITGLATHTTVRSKARPRNGRDVARIRNLPVGLNRSPRFDLPAGCDSLEDAWNIRLVRRSF